VSRAKENEEERRKMKWLINPPSKTGLYWTILPGHRDAQVVMVSKGFRGWRFQAIGDEEYYDMAEADAWSSRRPMKPTRR